MTERDYVGMAAGYQGDVLSGAIPACQWVRMACARNRGDLARQETPDFPYRFDHGAARKICQMAEMLPHIKGPKAKIIGRDDDGRAIWNTIQLEPWQCWYLTTMFGWLHQTSGLRRFRVSMLLVPRKNAKSTVAAIIVLYMLTSDGESGAECYCLDPDTRVLASDFRWRKLRQIKTGDSLIAFDEEPPAKGKFRKLRSSVVTSCDYVDLPTYRITLEDGREVVASAHHKWLAQTGARADRRLWIETQKLKPGALIRDLGLPWMDDHSREAGYLAGAFDGEACFHQLRRNDDGSPAKGDGFRLAFAQKPGQMMELVYRLCEERGFHPSPMRQHPTGSSADSFEISGFYDCARFLGQIRPLRLLAGALSWCDGRTPNRGTARHAIVQSVEFLGKRRLIAIGTSTKTLFAEGLFSHNSAATTRDQAKVVAEIAWEMAKRSPAFCDYFGVRIGAKTTYTLTVTATASKFAPLSSDAHTLDGLNISLAVVDELHAHKTRDVWDAINTATGARSQPLILITTTAGVEIGGICHEKMAYLHQLLDGTVTDESFFGVNYTIDDGDSWLAPETHRKANPNYGVSVCPPDKPEDLLNESQASKHSPGAINTFLTKHLNVWVRSEAGWMTATTWQTCADAELTLESLKAFPLFIGVDLGETRDPSSLALLFKTGPETYAFIPRIYMPASVVAHSPIAELSGWVRTDDIIETLGNEADYARISADLLELFRDYQVQEIDFDKRSARLMMQDLRAKLEPTLGRDRVERTVLDIPQNLDTMDPAMKTTEALVLGKKIRHNGNKAMAWMIGNIVVERDHKGQIYPRKAGGKDSHNKIDGAIALFTALSRAMQPTAAQPGYQMIVMGGGR